jgi:hypothetical protein
MDEHSSSVHSTTAGNAESYAWAYSVMDSSRVSTFFISILLIVYGSFRSLALEEDKDGRNEGCTKLGRTFMLRFHWRSAPHNCSGN